MLTYLAQLSLAETIPTSIHEDLLTQIHFYLMLGGMPAVLNHYFARESLQEAREIQTALLQTYRADFGKYSKQSEISYLEAVFTQLPTLVSEQIKYKKLDPNALSRNLKVAIEKLARAGLLTPTSATRRHDGAICWTGIISLCRSLRQP